MLSMWKTRAKTWAVVLIAAACSTTLLTSCGNPMDELKEYESSSISVVSPTTVTYTETFSFEGRSEDEITHLFEDELKLGNQVFKKSDVSYEILSQKPIMKQQTVSQQVSYPGLPTKELDAPKTITIECNGQQIPGDLQEITYESEGGDAEVGRSIHLTSNTNFGYTTSVPEAGESKTVDYQDTASGQTVRANLSFERMDTVEDWHWRNDVKIPITVTTYDANYYLLGDKKIPKNEESPALSGYESDLLQSVNLSSEQYRITRYEWDGEPYTKDGELCRNAVAYGERYVIQCQAVYSGDTALPDIKKEIYRGIAEYTASAELPTGETEYEVQGTVTYQSEETSHIPVPLLILSVGAAVVILACLLILIVLAKRSKQQNNRE